MGPRLREDGGLGIAGAAEAWYFELLSTAIEEGDRIVPGCGALTFLVRGVGKESRRLPLARAGEGSATRSAKERYACPPFCAVICECKAAGRGEEYASWPRGLRRGRAVVEEIDRGVQYFL